MKLLSWLICAAVAAISVPAAAQDREVVNPAEPFARVEAPTVPRQALGGVILQDQRPMLVTHPGAGAGGADVSRLQFSSLAMTTLGFGASSASAYRVADDFTVPADGWTISDIVVYAYQTGSTTTSTMTGLNFQIWDGDPSSGTANIVFGDTLTNRLTSTSFENIYRDSESAPGGTTRPIMAINASGLSINLPAGTYWLDWQLTGSLGSGPWAPPITTIGQTTTGNAVQFNGAAWAAIQDVGPQGLPITIGGLVNAAPSQPVPALSMWAVLAMLAGVFAAGYLVIQRR